MSVSQIEAELKSTRAVTMVMRKLFLHSINGFLLSIGIRKIPPTIYINDNDLRVCILGLANWQRVISNYFNSGYWISIVTSEEARFNEFQERMRRFIEIIGLEVEGDREGEMNLVARAWMDGVISPMEEDLRELQRLESKAAKLERELDRAQALSKETSW
jgi:hypothetical protein